MYLLQQVGRDIFGMAVIGALLEHQHAHDRHVLKRFHDVHADGTFTACLFTARRLADLVRGSGYRISTGFVGTPLVCDALCAVGESATAYRLLLQRMCPSWLYPVTMGATTIWERWDSMLSNGAINPGEMTLFNHYALGAVADWLHRTVAGLSPATGRSKSGRFSAVV